jgi:DNA mismatch repair protein MutL
MADIIQLLPDSVANQIAAGEVIQRPASVVKELVENAVDASADEIKVIIKDAGRTLIQVIDNGAGMSDTDARLAFERHATSKIKTADDLFEIRTKGFRGEALASIAAVAQVILKTKQPDEEIGTEIIINGSELEHQIAVNCPSGSNFIVKNLFYNVPARRKFLKGNSTELKHIIVEFQRVALCHPEILFSLVHNDSNIYRLPNSNLRQRIVHVFGKSINVNLNNIDADTSLVSINGFIGKPEFARKTTGEQFFFVNRRYMRHPYFHRAVMRAYEKILPSETYPSYFIFLDTDPHNIDVNIHPTKTEIKFENEQAIFQIIQASVKESLGKFSVVPSIDFNTEGVVEIPVLRKDTKIRTPEIDIDHAYNPFETKHSGGGKSDHHRNHVLPSGWEQLYNDSHKIPEAENATIERLFDDKEPEENISIDSEYLQLRNKYILTPVKSGLMVIDQKRAHERILYEQFIRSVAHNQNMAQRELYPVKVDLDPAHYLIVNEIKDELLALGFDIGDLGSNTIVVNSCPTGLGCSDPKSVIEQLLEEFKETDSKVGTSLIKTIAASLAKVAAIEYGRVLHLGEMQQLVDELFACENSNHAPDGKKIISIMKTDEFEKLLS